MSHLLVFWTIEKKLLYTVDYITIQVADSIIPRKDLNL